jgi:hypothetical protein
MTAFAAGEPALAPELAATLSSLSAELLEHVDEIAAIVTDRAVTAEPRLADPDDQGWVEAVRHSTRANVGAVLSTLAYGVPGSAVEPARGALELYRRLADRDDGLVIVMRGYRLGITALWQLWARHVGERVEDKDTAVSLLVAGHSHMAAYVDAVGEVLAERWQETRRQRRLGLDVAPDELLRRALYDPDAAEAVAALGPLDYPVDRRHLAVTLPARLDDGQVAQLASRLRLAARASTAALRDDDGWVLWFALPDDGDAEDLAALLRDELGAAQDAPIGVGGAARGIEGFRSTHREALDALRVARLRGDVGVTRFDDIALLALLCADTERAHALVARELGALAGDDEVTERLRETLAAYLACGDSHVGAADRLHVHKKTVAYRIRQAEELLGRRVGDRRVELEAALLLHRALRS